MTLPVFLTDGNGNKVSFVNGSLPVSTGTSNSGAVIPVVISPSLDDGALDAFGRQRVSQPTTLFDSKLLGDNRPLDWDEAETSGSGTSSFYDTNRSDVQMAVTASTAGTRVRQTLRHFNYYTAKSQVIFQTFVMGPTPSGIKKRVGYFNDQNGLFVENDGGNIYVVKRSYVSGSVVDTRVAQANWNIDKLDGTGTNGFTLDMEKSQILTIDFEWLGVGRARMGFIIDGQFAYCHAFEHANKTSSVYMTSPNLPLRYEISNDGTGSSSEMYCICGSVASEGIRDQVGLPHSYSDTPRITLPDTTNWYLITAGRLKATHLHANILLRNIQTFCETSDSISYKLVVDPTFNASLTWTGISNSAIEVADGSATIKVTDSGYEVFAGHAYGRKADMMPSIGDFVSLGSKIDGTPTVMALIVKGNTSSAKIRSAFNWSE